jgi:hypothetical protein
LVLGGLWGAYAGVRGVTAGDLATATSNARTIIDFQSRLWLPSEARMMAGFIDTAAVVGPDPYALGISGGANQLAAMPSLHVGWAVLVALGVVWIGSSARRRLILVHPIMTLAVVVLTANHYWIDAIAAVAIVGAAWHLTHPPGHGEPTL